MEDAVDALKMAGSVFLFILALSIVFNMFSQARQVSDIVIARTDKRYYAQYDTPDLNTNYRTVGIETVIPTLYRYYKEKFSVDVFCGEQEKFDEETERLVYTRGGTGASSWENFKGLYPNGVSWLANPNVDTLKRTSEYIGGTLKEDEKVNHIRLKVYENKNLKNYKDSVFTEKFEQKNNGDKKYTGDDGTVIYLVKGTTKTYITYTKQ